MSIIAESPLSNKDLAPTGPEQRTWGTYHVAALWVGLSIVITTYTLASGLIVAGMEWWQGLLTVALGNLIVLIPILLNSLRGRPPARRWSDDLGGISLESTGEVSRQRF
jgi:nucleobase:cation symporter-1, NCS1 family